MTSDFEIGRIVAVDTAQLTIELGTELKAMTRATYEGTFEVGRINSYVLIPVGARRIVAMVTKVVMTEEAELRLDKTMVYFPSARRIMKATMIGTIDDNIFTQGINIFPILDSPVFLTTNDDLDAIFGNNNKDLEIDDENPGFCVPIGTSELFPDYDIKINPDVFFGKHSAIIGSTGSGKSCSIATVIQSILELNPIKRTRFIILDTTGEYRDAFQNNIEDDVWEDSNPDYHCLYIPTDPNKTDERLILPYWFMNSEDFIRLFRAKGGLQSPVLQRAIGIARSSERKSDRATSVTESMLMALTKIRALCENDAPNQQWAIPNNIKDICDDTLRFNEIFPKAWQEYKDLEIDEMINLGISFIKQIASEAGGNGLGATRIKQILDKVLEIISLFEKNGLLDTDVTEYDQSNPDAPTYFNLRHMVTTALDFAMKEQAKGSSPGRVREAVGPMMIRIQRYLTDSRYDFLFGLFPKIENVLAEFLRDILGLESLTDNVDDEGEKEKKGDNSNDQTQDENGTVKLPFHLRQRSTSKNPHNIVIIDLSLLASEVLENVTALLGRLILEFLQRAGETQTSNIKRGEFPVVLVLEEAQNYIKEVRRNEEESISKTVFERIAREGRKYGLGLMVSSQRPSELSKTVLSQCNSFIVHRLQNPEDLRYFKDIVPGIYEELLRQLPALAPQQALIFGEAVRAPVLVHMREANPLPRSRDPKFYKHWVAEKPLIPDVEAVSKKWEANIDIAKGDNVDSNVKDMPDDTNRDDKEGA